MKIQEVIELVEDIRKRAAMKDPNHEQLHVDSDYLYIGLLEAIADGTAEDPQAMAQEAIKTKKISFFRWCA